MRVMYSLLAGCLFGAGLLVSGMVDTAKVQGFLDIFGAWDPTLAFVMCGAMIPMALAWRVAAKRKASTLGTPFPQMPAAQFDRDLTLGSVLFGMGWALVGFCPGPAFASLSFGGWGGVVFLIAMAAAMLAAPLIRHPSQSLPKRTQMDIRALTDSYAVSPQIDLSDLAAIKAAGFTTVIDNRPDGEIPENLGASEMQRAAAALGLTFVINPLIPGAFTPQNIAVQAQACDSATGPVFAYCASGNRCSIIWALMNAGKMPVDDLIATPAKFGYRLDHLRLTLESLASK
jgi:uncharacterized protein (TIGR01244 family)